MKLATSTAELRANLAQGGIVECGPGQFDVTGLAITRHTVLTGTLDTQLVGDFAVAFPMCEFRNVYIRPTGQGLNLDAGAGFTAWNCIFRSLAGKPFAAVSLTANADKDASFKCKFLHTHFIGFQHGLRIPPTTDGKVNGWLFDGCTFDSCDFGILAEGPCGYWEINGGTCNRMAQAGFRFRGKSWKIDHPHFENNLFDIHVLAGSENNGIAWSDGKDIKLWDEGIGTQIKHGIEWSSL